MSLASSCITPTSAFLLTWRFPPATGSLFFLSKYQSFGLETAPIQEDLVLTNHIAKTLLFEVPDRPTSEVRLFKPWQGDKQVPWTLVEERLNQCCNLCIPGSTPEDTAVPGTLPLIEAMSPVCSQFTVSMPWTGIVYGACFGQWGICRHDAPTWTSSRIRTSLLSSSEPPEDMFPGGWAAM